MNDGPTDLHRDLGRVEGQLASQELRLARLEKLVGDIHEAVITAKGGWRMLLAVGTLSASMGAAITKALAYLKGA